MNNMWLSLLPSIITIGAAIWSKKILPSLLLGLVIGSYMVRPTPLGGIETAVASIVNTLTDKSNLQVLLFLFLFSGFMTLIKRAGGIKAFSLLVEKFIKNEKGVFYTIWGLLPFTFIDCGFRVVGAGSITSSLVEKNNIARERFAFMLNNTASPVIELIPIATTFVGFNIANIALGLKAAGVSDQPYQVWVKAIPFEFFSITIIAITFISIFFQFKNKQVSNAKPKVSQEKQNRTMMNMKMEDEAPEIPPRLINLFVPMVSIILFSLFFFWHFKSDPNKAMLIALFITMFFTGIVYAFQKYPLVKMSNDIIAGGNELMDIIAILTVAWSFGSISQHLNLAYLVQHEIGSALPAWSVAVSLFLLSSAITYFIGSGWAMASLVMPFAITLAVTANAGIPICVAAVITGGTFGDVSSPVAGMTNMSSHIAKADHMKYLRYAAPYNFSALILSAALFIIFSFI